MAFDYMTGIAPAPGEIDAWFAAFEAWIVATVGWTVESGSGTDDMVLSSPGELDDKTMLFIHVWRIPATTQMRMETMDDALGTHATTAGFFNDSGGVQFNYWMSADLDAIVVVWEQGGTYYLRYAGLLMPFAMNPADETYYSVSMYVILAAATILRRFDDVWDQNDMMYCNEWITEAQVDRDDGSIPIGGLYFGDREDVAGQYRHISCRIQSAAINTLDTITTHQDTGTTEWIVLQDLGTSKFALRTGGIAPTGDTMDRGNFAHLSGVAYTVAQLFDAIASFMAGRGWTTNDISGASGRPHDWEFNSAGESGTEDIWLRIGWYGATNHLAIVAADSALGTPGRHETTTSWLEFWNNFSFPTHFYITGDRDCILLTIQVGVSAIPVYGGVVMPTAPNLSSPYMRVVHFEKVSEPRVLLAHDGTWNQAIAWQRGGDDAHCIPSSPNNYDGTTTILWAINVADPIAGAIQEVTGQVKYMYACEGDSIGAFDIVRVNGEVYRKFFFYWGAQSYGWCMRIA